MARFVLPAPRPLRVLRQLLVWSGLLLRLLVMSAINAVRGRHDGGHRGRHLRRAIEVHGDTVALVARHLALRVDILPLDVCAQLAAIDDHRAPLALEVAIPKIEAAVGRPLATAFGAFDPTPIDADSLSTTWQAELADGRRVAVRVERADASPRLVAEVAALQLILRAGEWLTFYHPGRMDSVIRDLRQFMTTVLDTQSIYRAQQELRRRVRQAGLKKKVDAARVFVHQSNASVTISEFRAGIRVSEVIAALEGGDPDALAELRRQGVDPRLVGRRLLREMWWEIFETPMFPLTPRADAMVIEKGRRVVFVRTGACSNVSSHVLGNWHQTMHHLAHGDASRAAVSLVDAIEPMPYIDVAQLTQDLEERLCEQHLLMLDPKSSWHERSTMGIWIALANTARDHRFSLTPALVALMQATLNMELVVGRLTGGVHTLAAFRRYERRAHVRRARRFVRGARRVDPEGAGPRRAIAAVAALEGLRGIRHAIDSATRHQPISFYGSSGIGAFILGHALMLAGMLSMLALVTAGILSVRARAVGEPAPDLHRLVNPYTVTLAVFFGLVLLRRLVFRLNLREERS